MKKLSKNFIKYKCRFKQLERHGNVALYERQFNGCSHKHYEVFVIVESKDCVVNGQKISARENMPGASTWGNRGWTYLECQKQEAFNKFNELVKSESASFVNSVSNKKRGKKHIEINFKFPKGEFTVKQIAESHNISPALVHLRFKKMSNVKKVGERKSSSGRGKPTNIYKVIN